MKSLTLPALLALAGACSQTPKWRNVTVPPAQAASYVVEEVWTVRDRDTGARVGLLFKHRYKDQRVVYWVKDDTGEKRGYVLANNRAYKYDWHVGQRAPEARFIGADTMSTGSRRILEYGRPVRLEATSMQALLDEVSPEQKAKPQPGKSEGCGGE